MMIDRSRFLLLTSALAAVATGCTINEINSGTDATTTDSGTVADSGSGDTSVADSTVTDSGTSEVAETSGETSDDGSADGDGATCTDDVPSPNDCASILTGVGCHDAVTPTLADQACSGWVANDKPREAKAAQDCLTGLMTAAGADGGAPTCEGIDWSSCNVEALETACPDPTAGTWCEGLLSDCAAAAVDAGVDGSTPPTTLDDCTHLAAGLTDAGRSAAYSCVVTEGGCTTPLRSCL